MNKPGDNSTNSSSAYDPPSNQTVTDVGDAEIDGQSKLPWWRGLSNYHWFVFIIAACAWGFDCLDQQIFTLARQPALEALLSQDGKVNVEAGQVSKYAGYATTIFMLGWATGGIIFGPLGDRFGRAKMLTVTVLMYSICTGLSAFSVGWLDFAIYRFITGLGVGGVFGLAVALVADTLPERSRSPALGVLQASSAIFNISAGGVSILAGALVASQVIPGNWGWKAMFLVGAVPALLCVFLALRMREPEKWVQARKAGKVTGVKLGSYADLFGERQLMRNSIGGMMLCVAGVFGLWGIGFFAPDLVRAVIRKSLEDSGQTITDLKAAEDYWVGFNGIVQNTGSFFGMLGFTFVAQWLGRKKAFLMGFVSAAAATVLFFQFFKGTSTIWLSFFMGFFQLGLFAGFAIYLPELFPLRLRSTGISFCYNVGRYLAALGPLILTSMQDYFANGAAKGSLERIDAFRDAGAYMCAFYLIGIIALFFLPETKGRPLPV